VKTLQKVIRTDWHYLAILAFLLLFPFIVQWITGDSATGVNGRQRGLSVYWQGLMIEVFIFAILAMSYNLIFGFTGVISFGHALFFGVGGYSLAIAIEKVGLGVWGVPIGAAVGIFIAAGLGLVVGLVSLRLRGVYFALFTLAVAEMFFIYFSRFNFTQAEDGFTVSELPYWLNPTRSRLSFYYFTLVLAVLTFWFIRRLMRSPVGSVFLAIRENEERAQAIGYNTLNFKLFAIVISSMMASGAGVLHVILNKKVGPEILGLGFTVDPLLSTIIGGTGTFIGPVLGAAGIHLSDRMLRDAVFTVGTMEIDVGASWNVILGLAFILVVIVFPRGVVGTWNQWRQRNVSMSKHKTQVTAPDQPGATVE
jgi:branched-chain amino acid transport system permease protein